MSQVSWRADDELVERVRLAARAQGRSMNDYVTRVLDAATNPELAATEMERVRARLIRAGVLVEPGPAKAGPDDDALARARRAAGRGTPLSDLVERGRG